MVKKHSNNVKLRLQIKRVYRRRSQTPITILKSFCSVHVFWSRTLLYKSGGQTVMEPNIFINSTLSSQVLMVAPYRQKNWPLVSKQWSWCRTLCLEILNKVLIISVQVYLNVILSSREDSSIECLSDSSVHFIINLMILFKEKYDIFQGFLFWKYNEKYIHKYSYTKLYDRII